MTKAKGAAKSKTLAAVRKAHALVGDGARVTDALKAVGISTSTYYNYRNLVDGTQTTKTASGTRTEYVADTELAEANSKLVSSKRRERGLSDELDDLRATAARLSDELSIAQASNKALLARVRELNVINSALATTVTTMASKQAGAEG